MTRYRITGASQPLLPGLGDDADVTSFIPAPRRWQQRGVKVGSWFIPLGRWKRA